MRIQVPVPVWIAVLSLFFEFSGGCLRAQVIEVSGGSSTLFQSTGGTVSMRGRSYSTSIGAGTVGRQFFGGGQLVKKTDKTTLILGSDSIPFDLPTDIFQGGHYLTGIGAGLKTKAGATNFYGFAGATSTSFNSPFFGGARADTASAILFISSKIAPKWSATTRMILSKSPTVINSFAYDSGDGTTFAISGGLGASQLYGASSVSITRAKFDLKGAYIAAGSQFRRVSVAVPLTSEPDRENVLFTVRPTDSLSLTVGRQNYLTPIYQSKANLRSSVDQISANYFVAGWGLAAMAFRSSVGDDGNTAFIYSAAKSVSPSINIQASYFVSMPDHSEKSNSLVTNVQETVTSRLSLSQTINSSGGQNSLGFGGSFLSNFATVSADYQTYYVPQRTQAPFEQALILNVQVNLFGRLTLTGATFVAPNGHLLYTTAADGTVSRQVSGESNAIEHHIIGAMIVRGRVLDSGGEPIMGAAILLDQVVVYSDSQGYFYVRERRARSHPLTVLVNQFLDGMHYRVISAPGESMSSATKQPDIIIVVERVTALRVKG